MKNLYILPVFTLLTLGIHLSQHTPWIEMLIYPYLLNNDMVLYKDVVVPYTPIFIWFLQGITYFFGYNPNVSLYVTLFLTLINTFLIYFYANKMYKSNNVAILATLIYALWFFYFEGNSLWFEIFLVPFLLSAYYFLHRYYFISKKNVHLVIGLMVLVLAFFIKQSSIWLIILFAGWVIFTKNKFSKFIISSILLGFIIFIITTIPAIIGNYLPDYLYWAYYYTFILFPQMDGHKIPPTLNELIKLLMFLILLLPFVLSKQQLSVKFFSIIFLIGTFMFSIPRWGFFHLQPFLALAVIVSAPHIYNLLIHKIWRIVIFLILTIWLVVITRQFLRFVDLPYRFYNQQVYEIADYMKNYDNYFIFNSSDQVYLINNHIPNISPYTENFSWYLEIDGMQERVIESMKKSKPEYILTERLIPSKSFKIGEYYPEKILDYINKNYKMSQEINQYIILRRI